MTNRDLIFTDSGSEYYLTSIDSGCGIGHLPNDTVISTISETTYYVAKTCISEVICVGGSVLNLSIGTSISHSNKSEMLKGLSNISNEIGNTPDFIFSHENYFSIAQSFYSISCLGKVSKDELLYKKLSKGNFLFLYGSGYIDNNFHSSDLELPQLSFISDLIKQRRESLVQIIPIGSRGLTKEFGELEKVNGVHILASNLSHEELNRPGGPGLMYLIISTKSFSSDRLKFIGIVN